MKVKGVDSETGRHAWEDASEDDDDHREGNKTGTRDAVNECNCI